MAYRGFLAPGQEVESEPFFPDFLTKNSKMVDPKLISVIFKSEKHKKKKKKKNLKGLHGFTRSHKPSSLNFLTFCVFTQSCTIMVGAIFFIPDRFQRPP